MVKVTIERDGRVLKVLEGDCVHGAVHTHEGGRIDLNAFFVGKHRGGDMPEILADTAYNLVRRATEGREDPLYVAAKLNELLEGLEGRVKRYLSDHSVEIARGIVSGLKGGL